MNNSTSTELRCFIDEGAAYYSLHVIIGFLIVCINCGVIYTMATNSYLRTKRNAFLASLTVSDLLAGLVGIPLHILCSCYNLSLGNLCLAQAICFRFISISTMLNIFMITIERYIGIIYPIKYALILTKSRVVILLSCTWATSVSSALVSFSWLLSSNAGNRVMPERAKQLERNYFIFSFIAFFLLPLVIMIVLYSRMFRTISKARRSASKARTYLDVVVVNRAQSSARGSWAERRVRSCSHGSYGDHLTVHGRERLDSSPRLRSRSLLSAPEVLHSSSAPEVLHSSSIQSSVVVFGSQTVAKHQNETATFCEKSSDSDKISFTRKFSNACGTAASRLRMLRRASREDRLGHARVAREYRVLIIFVTMLTVFVVCWSTWYIMLFDFTQMFHVPDVILDCFDILRVSVSFFNPILYTFLKKDFRIAFVKSFKGRQQEKTEVKKLLK